MFKLRPVPTKSAASPKKAVATSAREAVREDPELFRVGDYVLLVRHENKAQTIVGMVLKFTGHDEMDVFAPSMNVVFHHVPIDVDRVVPIRFQGIRGRHCEMFVDETPNGKAATKRVIYWDGDHVIENAEVYAGACERVSFSSADVSRESLKDMRSLIDRLDAKQLRDRLRELKIDVHDAKTGRLLSLAGLRKRYETQMLDDIRTSLTRCDQLVRVAQSQCNKLEASCV
jgi:hypothetical protein